MKWPWTERVEALEGRVQSAWECGDTNAKAFEWARKAIEDVRGKSSTTSSELCDALSRISALEGRHAMVTGEASACPRCKSAEAERLGDAVEPGTNQPIGSVYGCLRCRTKFSVVRGESKAFGDVIAEPVSRTVEPEHIPRREDLATLIQRDPDMRWDRTR